MTLDDDVQLLSSVGFFQTLPVSHLRLLAFRAEKAFLRKNEILYNSGDHAACAYVISQGCIRLFTKKNGESVDIGKVGVGSILGELALISRILRSSSALALEDSFLMIIERRAFRRILEEYPETAMALYTKISSDIQNTASQIKNLSDLFSD